MADDSHSSRLAIWLAAVALVVAIVALAVAVLRDDSTQSTASAKSPSTTVPYKVPKGSRLVGEKTITVTNDGPQMVELGPIDASPGGSKSSGIAIQPASHAVGVKQMHPQWTYSPKVSVRVPFDVTGTDTEPVAITVRAIVTP